MILTYFSGISYIMTSVIPILHRDLCPGDYRLLLLFAYQQVKCSQHSLCTECGASAQDESC